MSPQRHISFLSLFFRRNITGPPDKCSWQELFKSAQELIFFWFPSFQNLGLKVVPPPPPSRKGGGADTLAGLDTLTVCSKAFDIMNVQRQKICYFGKRTVTSKLWNFFIFLIKPFFLRLKSKDENLNILRTKRAFKINKKRFS